MRQEKGTQASQGEVALHRERMKKAVKTKQFMERGYLQRRGRIREIRLGHESRDSSATQCKREGAIHQRKFPKNPMQDWKKPHRKGKGFKIFLSTREGRFGRDLRDARTGNLIILRRGIEGEQVRQ